MVAQAGEGLVGQNVAIGKGGVELGIGEDVVELIGVGLGVEVCADLVGRELP